MASLVLVFSMFWVFPLLMRARVTTTPELMGRRFDEQMRKYLSASRCSSRSFTTQREPCTPACWSSWPLFPG